MILLGIPHFVTKQSLFYKSNESKSVLPQENGGCRDSSGITKIKQIFHRNFQNLCNIKKLVQRNRCFSIWCLNIADMCTAEVGCLCQFCLCKSTKFAIISNGQTEKSKLIHAFVVHKNRRIACVSLSVQQNISKRNNIKICKYKVKYCKIRKKFEICKKRTGRYTVSDYFSSVSGEDFILGGR